MTNNTPHNPSDIKRHSALSDILRRISSRGAQFVMCTSALGAIALIPGSQTPFEFIAAGIGVNLLSTIIDRVAQGEKISDDELQAEVAVAIQNSKLDQLLTKDDFQRALSKLIRNQNKLLSTNQGNTFELIDLKERMLEVIQLLNENNNYRDISDEYAGITYTLIEAIKNSVVKISNQSYILGTGLLINNHHILACNKLIKVREPQEKTRDCIKITFPLNDDSREFIVKITENDSLFQKDLDCNILEIDDFSQDITKFAPTISLDPKYYWHHKFVTYGYPDNVDNGLYIEGIILGPTDNQWIELKGTGNSFEFIGQRFIGSAIWDTELEAIVGLIVAVDENLSNRIAYMKPMTAIAKIWPDLLRIQYKQLKARWSASIENHYSIQINDVPSPLQTAWDYFSTSQPWNERISGLINRVISSLRLFRGLHDIGAFASQIKIDADYEKIYINICRLLKMLETSSVKKHIEEQIYEQEKYLGITTDELRNVNRYKLSSDEERLLQLGAIKQHIIELRNLSNDPNFNRCLLIMGGMGSGKTHFLNQISLECQDSHDLIILPLTRVEPTQNIHDILLINLRKASGILWPDLESFNLFLQSYDQSFGQDRKRVVPQYMDSNYINFLNNEDNNFISEPNMKDNFDRDENLQYVEEAKNFDLDIDDIKNHHTRIIIAIDDLSRWALDLEGFLPELIKLISSSSNFKSYYWVLTIPNSYYVQMTLNMGSYRQFWNRYGVCVEDPELRFYKKPLKLPNLERWISVDKLNEKYEIGLKVIKNGLSIEADEVELAIEHSETAKKNLSNPLIAWAWLEIVNQAVPSNLITAINLNFIEFIMAFWQKQFHLLISHRMNQQNQFRFEEDQLRYFVILTAKYLTEIQEEKIKKIDLFSFIEKKSERKFGFVNENRSKLALDLLKQGLVLQESEKNDRLETPIDCLEIRFDSFWGYFIAQEFFDQIKNKSSSMQQLELLFAKILPRMVPDTLEFFLLLQDTKNQSDSLRYFELVLASNNLPQSSIWMACTKSSTSIKSAMSVRALRAVGRVFDAQTLFSYLYFLSELPYQMVSLKIRFQTFQKLYSQIGRQRLTDYFIYITNLLFELVKNTKELINLMPHFTGCEKIGKSKDIAELSVDKLIYMFDKEHGLIHTSKDILESAIDYLRVVKDEHYEQDRDSYREWVIHFVLYDIAYKYGLSTYSRLQDVNWYEHPEFRKNGQLTLHMERKANEAIGMLFRINRYKKDFLDFIKGLSDSDIEKDRINAIHIIRHTVLIGEEENQKIVVSDKFHPILRKLIIDINTDLREIFRNQKYINFFRDNLDDYDFLYQNRIRNIPNSSQKNLSRPNQRIRTSRKHKKDGHR